jgi:hypothetical protein
MARQTAVMSPFHTNSNTDLYDSYARPYVPVQFGSFVDSGMLVQPPNWMSNPGRAWNLRKSDPDARAQWQQSTVLVAALHHHAELQDLWHYRGFGVQPDRMGHPTFRLRASSTILD